MKAAAEDLGIALTFEELVRKPDAYELVFEWVSRKVRYDNRVKHSIFSTAISAWSPEPLNLFLKGPSSSGKTWAVTNIVELFPKESVWWLGGLSPTAIAHDHGQLMDADGNPITEGMLQTMDREAARRLLKDAYIQVDMSRKILVFLEPPPYETYMRLRPILSHDTEEISYKFTEKSGKTGLLKTTHVKIKGWPATIHCVSDIKYMEDLVTRSLTVTPEESQDKFRAAHLVSAQRFSYPQSPEEEREATAVREWLRHVIEDCYPIYNPFAEAIARVFPTNMRRDMRDFKKFLMLVEAHAMLHRFNRPFLKAGLQILQMVVKDDVEATIKLWADIVETTRHGISEGAILLFDKVLSSLYDSRNEVSEVTYKAVMDKWKEKFGRPLPKSTLTTFIRELEGVGWVETASHSLDKRMKVILVYPEIRSESSDWFDEHLPRVFSKETIGKWLNQMVRVTQVSHMEIMMDNGWVEADPELLFQIAVCSNYLDKLENPLFPRAKRGNGSSNQIEHFERKFKPEASGGGNHG
jgi:hypothetical protein